MTVTLNRTLSWSATGFRYALFHWMDPIDIPIGSTAVRFTIVDGGSSDGVVTISFRVVDSDGVWLANQSFTFAPGATDGPGGWLTIPAGGTQIVPFMSDACTSRTDCIILTASVTLEFDGVFGTVCEYGTETNPDASFYSAITGALVDIVATAVCIQTGQLEALPTVITALDALIGLPLLAFNCSQVPPPAPALDLTNLATLSNDALLLWFRNAAWSFYCRCVPAPGGSPAPTPPPPPVIIPPPGGGGGSPTVPLPPQPVLTCSNEDICTTLGQIMSVVQSISGQVVLLRRDVTLIQRQKVPFAYVHGANHPGLSGRGVIAVSGILGLSVGFSAAPSWLGSDMDSDAPSSYWFGHINLGTADGWLRKLNLTHNPQLILELDGDVSRIEYQFGPGVTGYVQELLREP